MLRVIYPTQFMPWDQFSISYPLLGFVTGNSFGMYPLYTRYPTSPYLSWDMFVGYILADDRHTTDQVAR